MNYLRTQTVHFIKRQCYQNKKLSNNFARAFSTRHQLYNVDSQHPNHTKAQLLDYALERVPQFGFSAQSIERGMLSLDYPELPPGLFPRGGLDLINHYLVKSRLDTVETVRKLIDAGEVAPNDVIHKSLEVRLKLSEPYIRKWGEAVALMTTDAAGVQLATTELFNLVDDILYLAKDKSYDMSWYYKRLMISKVFTSSEIFMTQDTSVNFQETYDFLQRQLTDIDSIKGGLLDIGNMANFFRKSVVGVVESTGHRL